MAKRATQEVFASRFPGAPGLIDRLLDVVGTIPTPREERADDPAARSRVIARKAAAKAATTAGALALPPGPLGWVTIAPELYAVWKIQAQMVADIAGAYGKPELLSREQMLYCLFSHTSAKAFSDLVIRVGQRYLVRRAPLSAMYAIANKVAIRIAQRSAGRMITRWVPALGALGVAGYVFFDTGKVADASIELFSADVLIEGEVEEQAGESLSKAAKPTAPKRSASKSAASKSAAPKSPRAKIAPAKRAAPAKMPKQSAPESAAKGKPRPSKPKAGPVSAKAK